MVGTEGSVQQHHQEHDLRPKIEIVRVPSIERASFRPLDGVQLRAAYSHVRVGTYCPEPSPEQTTQLPFTPNKRPPTSSDHKKHKKNLGPVSRLLRRRHQATSLATKSCDNIYNVNKNNSFFEWKHGNGHDQGRQSNSLDWRASRSINRNSSNLDRRKASRSAEQLSRSGTLQTPSTKSKIVSLLRRLSPRLPRPSSKGSLPSSPSICPWVQVEYASPDVPDGLVSGDDPEGGAADASLQDSDYQREVQLNEIKKRAAVKRGSGGTKTELQLPNDALTSAAATVVAKENKRSPRNSLQPNVQIQVERQDTNPRAVQLEDTAQLQQLQQQQQQQPVLVEQESRIIPTSVKVAADPVEQRPGSHTPRRRPHSLAVQPLNYQRFDPELELRHLPHPHQQAIQGVGAGAPGPARKPPTTAAPQPQPPTTNNNNNNHTQPQPQSHQGHPNMTSQESIGSCSLDVERSASERSDVNAGSLSEKTLHSLSLSCSNGGGDQFNGDGVTPHVNGTHENGSGRLDQHHQLGDHEADQQLTTNGANSTTITATTINGKKPSYLGLACSINGYSGITRYDSKLREGFRSRDSSPGARLITRDTSPAGFRTNDNLNVGPQPLKSISPLAMEQRNGYTNGKCGSDGGYSEVDRGYPDTKHSPIHSSSPNKKSSPVGAKIVSLNQMNNRDFGSPRYGHNVSSHNESNILNGSLDPDNLNSSTEKSFIQQRVERLYGPGALAQGFFFKRSTTTTTTTTMTKLNTSNNSDKSSNNNNPSLDDSNNSSFIEESLKNLPVLRHLRPEFRAQLPVVSPRKPTDGTEQIIKPLKRISIPTVKNDAKETIVKPEKIEIEVNNDSQMTASVTSLTDQQPAAPKVVLPVDPVEIQTATPKRSAEVPEAIEEKDGHYFMTVLNNERERLISLAEKAERELHDSSSLPEDASGKLRSAAGKARLLATQKMKQFEGLCQKNINQIPGEEFPTTSEDLAGFWDMVMLQVVQVNDIFDNLDRSRENKWKDVSHDSKSSPTTPQNGSAGKRRPSSGTKVKTNSNSEALRKAREAREQNRKQLLEEKRRAMRANANNSDNSAVKIFVPET